MDTLVIGIDPGLAATGYGIINTRNGFHHITHGTIRTPSHMPTGERLTIIHTHLKEVIDTYRPTRAGIEMLYFARNVTSAIPVAQARGVVLLLLNTCNIACAEYPPQIIKRMITDDGRASKEQMRIMVETLLANGISSTISNHAVDALAAAMCHHNSTVTQYA